MRCWIQLSDAQGAGTALGKRVARSGDAAMGTTNCAASSCRASTTAAAALAAYHCLFAVQHCEVGGVGVVLRVGVEFALPMGGKSGFESDHKGM